MGTTTIFGSEIDIRGLKVSQDICRVIDDFGGENDGIYEKIGHVKLYSPSLALMINYSIPIGIVLSLASLKILSRILPNKSTLLLSCLALVIGCGASAILKVWLGNFHLNIKSPVTIGIIPGDEDMEDITIGEQQLPSSAYPFNVYRKVEIRSLSDMRLKYIRPLLRVVLGVYYPTSAQNLAERNNIIFKLNNGKIDVYLSDDYHEPIKNKKNGLLSKNDYESRDKLHSLPTPTNVTAFDTTKRGDLIVALSENGVYKFELQRRKSLYTIMNTRLNFINTLLCKAKYHLRLTDD